MGNNAQAEITNNLIYNCYDHGHLGNENKVGIGILCRIDNWHLNLGKYFGIVIPMPTGTGNNPAHRLIWAPLPM